MARFFDTNLEWGWRWNHCRLRWS